MVLGFFEDYYIRIMFVFFSVSLFIFFKKFLSIQNILKYDYIYPLSWEDANVDREVLKINEEDSLICITTGGDNILNYLIDEPKEIITCDFNKHQNFLLEMKMSSISVLNSDEYYEMYFNNNLSIWKKNKIELINNLKSTESKNFWAVNGNDIFKNFIFSGSCKYIKYLIYIFPSYVYDFFNKDYNNLEEQQFSYYKIRNKLTKFTKIWDYFLFDLKFVELLGVPVEQCNTNEQNKCIDFVDYICTKTFVKYNYFYKAYLNGKLDKDNLPEYCKEKNYEKVKSQLHKIKIYTDSLENVLKTLDSKSITKGSLLDHMDWMNDIQINNELYQLSRVVDDNHKIIYRSFSNFIPKNSLVKVTNWTDFVHNSKLDNVDRLGTYYTLHTIKFNKDLIYSNINNCFTKEENFAEDMNIIKNMYFNKMNKKLNNHQDKLNSFYKNQANYYDTYRKNMLHGRDSLIASIPFKKNSNWLDVGGGTGYSINLLGKGLDMFKKVDIIEYSSEMYNVLKKNTKNLDNVEAFCQDIHTFNPTIKYDVITFSYSLSMIPEQEKALDHVIKLLKPGGIIAITDFYADDSRIGKFWKNIFYNDGVYPNDNIINWMNKYNNKKIIFTINSGGFPYIPLLKCKYYTGIFKVN
jgi:ubiquinone/menaquinone biosynthesis C-methylase UbiE